MSKHNLFYRLWAIACRLSHQLLCISIGIYASIIVLWFGLRLVFGDRLWWLGLINALALYLFLPLLLLIPLAIIQTIWFYRHSQSASSLACSSVSASGSRLSMAKRSIIGLSIPLTLFGWIFGKHFVPPGLKAPPTRGSTFEVMTFNTLFNNQESTQIAEMVAQAQPDIIALQEIHPKNRDAVTMALAEYPYAVYHPNTDKHTIGLVSHFPILSVEPLAYPPLKRGLRVIVEVENQPIQIIVTHLTPNLIKHQSWPQYIEETEAWFRQRDQEMALLTKELGNRSLPTLILCDCNMTNTAQTYQDLDRHAADGFLNAGWGLGLTVFHPLFPFPVIRFDYVWHTPELEVVKSDIPDNAGSDHHPVTATIQFSEQTPRN